MKLNELKIAVDKLIDRGCSDYEVLITLKETSIGARASTNVRGLFEGFDWEKGQIRIESEKPLISYEKDRDKAIPIRIEKNTITEGKTLILRKCPKCWNKVTRNHRFCPNCGQKLQQVNNNGEIL